jgi:hypothetical protein
MYIDAEIGRHDIFKIGELRGMVVQKLQGKSEGMFLWAKLMIDDLRKSDTPGQVMERLRDLPSGHEKAYRLLFFRLLEQLDNYELVLARNILTFTIAAFRPSEVEEVQYAHALNSVEFFLLVQGSFAYTTRQAHSGRMWRSNQHIEWHCPSSSLAAIVCKR